MHLEEKITMEEQADLEVSASGGRQSCPLPKVKRDASQLMSASPTRGRRASAPSISTRHHCVEADMKKNTFTTYKLDVKWEWKVLRIRSVDDQSRYAYILGEG